MSAINTVCLCGSTRYLGEFNEANIQLTGQGLSIITISMALNSEQQREHAALKELLDLVHFNKILRADAVVVVGDGYMGFSTSREVLWARMQGKPVHMQLDYSDKMSSGLMTNWEGLAQAIVSGTEIHSAQYEQAERVLREKASAEAK